MERSRPRASRREVPQSEGSTRDPAYSQGGGGGGPSPHRLCGGPDAVPEGQVLGVGDLGAQTELALESRHRSRSGATPEDVVKLTVCRARAGLPGGVRRLPAVHPRVRAGPPDFLVEIEASPSSLRRPARGRWTCPPARAPGVHPRGRGALAAPARWGAPWTPATRSASGAPWRSKRPVGPAALARGQRVWLGGVTDLEPGSGSPSRMASVGRSGCAPGRTCA